MKDLCRLLLDRAEHAPQNLALKRGPKTITYGGLVEQAGRAAAELSVRGLKKGDAAVLAMDGSLESVILYYALLFLGAVTVPINPTLPAPALAAILRRARARMICLSSPSASTFESPSAQEIPIRLELGGKTPAPSFTSAAEIVSAQRPALSPRAQGTDAVALMFTTGTTGAPKGVLLSLDNITAAAGQINTFMDLRADDHEAFSLPMYHSFGLGRVRCLLSAGASGTILPSFFRPELLLKTIKDSSATVFAQVPSGIRLLMAWGERLRPFVGSVRLIEIGSASLTVEEKSTLMGLFPGTRIVHHYGLTEASRSLFLDYSEARRLGYLESLGHPAPGVDADLRPNADSYETGEILIRGAHTATAYLDENGQAVAIATHDGWLRTGDLARRDERGSYYFVGRLGDEINLGGYKVDPLEIETALASHPSISEAAVASARSNGADSAPELIAFIVLSDREAFDEAAMRSSLSKRLESYKIPARFLIVDSLPKTESGKLLRKKLPSLVEHR